MPWGYAVSVVLVTWCTVFALVPVRRSPRLSRISWMFALVINELPFLAAYWLLAATVLAFAQGTVHGPGGWAVVGLAAVTMLGLTVVARRGSQARPVTDRALAAALGAGWRSEIDPALAAGLRRRPPYGAVLLRPLPVRPREVERVADLSYGDAGIRNRLDVYRHRARPSGAPTLVYFHGGGFRSGHKHREARPLLHRLASRGWVCMSANYRLSPQARFPDYLVDVKKVIAWTREHGEEYGADPGVLVVAGSSAGAHLAAMAALTPNDRRFQPGFEQADTSVTAAVGLYGYYGHLDSNPQLPSSPQAYVRPDAPPFLVVHGELDTYVPVEGAREFAESLRAISTNPVGYAELPGGQHSFDLFHSLRFEAVVDAVEAFAAWVRSPRSSG
jgi:acetyl esterase/lipase